MGRFQLVFSVTVADFWHVQLPWLCAWSQHIIWGSSFTGTCCSTRQGICTRTCQGSCTSTSSCRIPGSSSPEGGTCKGYVCTPFPGYSHWASTWWTASDVFGPHFCLVNSGSLAVCWNDSQMHVSFLQVPICASYHCHYPRPIPPLPLFFFEAECFVVVAPLQGRFLLYRAIDPLNTLKVFQDSSICAMHGTWPGKAEHLSSTCTPVSAAHSHGSKTSCQSSGPVVPLLRELVWGGQGSQSWLGFPFGAQTLTGQQGQTATVGREMCLSCPCWVQSQPVFPAAAFQFCWGPCCACEDRLLQTVWSLRRCE